MSYDMFSRSLVDVKIRRLFPSDQIGGVTVCIHLASPGMYLEIA